MEKRNKYIQWFVFPIPLHFALDDFDNKKTTPSVASTLHVCM